VPVCRVTNIAQTLRQLKDDGFVIFGADIKGEQLHTLDFDRPCVIVMGSEGDGMRRLTRTFCDAFARIDMAAEVESLNVSVAAAIFLYQASLGRNL
jgi:23S rRNA (guanosine2251-2'-O)-methyltransferase